MKGIFLFPNLQAVCFYALKPTERKQISVTILLIRKMSDVYTKACTWMRFLGEFLVILKGPWLNKYRIFLINKFIYTNIETISIIWYCTFFYMKYLRFTYWLGMFIFNIYLAFCRNPQDGYWVRAGDRKRKKYYVKPQGSTRLHFRKSYSTKTTSIKNRKQPPCGICLLREFCSSEH